MKMKTLSISVFVAVQLIAASFARAQTASSDNLIDDLEFFFDADDEDSVLPMPPGPPPFMEANVSEMLSGILSLTDAQKAQFQTYFDLAQPALDQIHEQARHAANIVMKQLDTQIRPLLMPEQQTKLDQFEAMRAARPPAPAVSGGSSASPYGQ